MNAEKNGISLFVQGEQADLRLDVFLAQQLPDCSRSLAASLIRGHSILVNSHSARPSRRLKTGDHITGIIPPPAPLAFEPEPLFLDIIFEDPSLLLINKPSGMVVHPAPGNTSGTLVNALLYHFQALSRQGFDDYRPGIVHRLDKDTSGIMVIAKTLPVSQSLMEQFKARTVTKQYVALVHGYPPSFSGTIEAPVGRHPLDRKRMALNSAKGRWACTHWQVRQAFESHKVTLLDIQPTTGRTHQIRVHLAAHQHPLLGDDLYGQPKLDQKLGSVSSLLTRQMLHAQKLSFKHPVTLADLEFQVPMPQDMQDVMAKLMGSRQAVGQTL